MQLKSRYPFYLASKPVDSGRHLAVTDKYSGEVVTHVALADATDSELGIQLATTVHRDRVTEALTGQQSAIVLVDDVDTGVRVVNSSAA